MNDYIIFNEKKIKVQNYRLKLNYKMIYDLSEIKGLQDLTFLERLNLNSNLYIKEIKCLEKLVDLKELYLRNNKILEIKGLKTLKNLRFLDLAENNITEIKGLDNLKSIEILDFTLNKIKELKGLESLVNLRKLYIGKNLLPHKIINELGGLTKKGMALYPQNFVQYCQERKVKEQIKIKEILDKKSKEDTIGTCPFCGKFIEDELFEQTEIKCENCGEIFMKHEIKEFKLDL